MELSTRKYLTDSEYDHLIYVLERYKHQNLRDCVLIYLAAETGARAQEILNLKRGDINEKTRTVYIKGLKGSNDRELPIKPWLCGLLLKITTTRGPIFTIGYDRLRQIWDLYRPCGKTFHSLRHTFAIRLYQRTKDIRLVQHCLGHKRIATTEIYSKYVYTTNELRKALL